MSNRFRLFSWAAAIGDLVIAAVFYTSHPAMAAGPSYHYVFLLIPWQAWCVAFFLIGLAICGAIGTNDHRKVRTAACVSVVALILWATEFAFILPAAIQGRSVSWMGFVLVSMIAIFELIYLGMSASPWLDHVPEGGEYHRHVR